MKVHTDDPEIFGATVQNSVGGRDLCTPGLKNQSHTQKTGSLHPVFQESMEDCFPSLELQMESAHPG
jgi:hypothetical protein